MGANYLSPVLVYLRAHFDAHVAALRVAWADKDRGASAVELAVITVIILLAAGLLLGVIYTFVKRESKQIKAPAP